MAFLLYKGQRSVLSESQSNSNSNSARFQESSPSKLFPKPGRSQQHQHQQQYAHQQQHSQSQSHNRHRFYYHSYSFLRRMIVRRRGLIRVVALLVVVFQLSMMMTMVNHLHGNATHIHKSGGSLISNDGNNYENKNIHNNSNRHHSPFSQQRSLSKADLLKAFRQESFNPNGDLEYNLRSHHRLPEPHQQHQGEHQHQHEDRNPQTSKAGEAQGGLNPDLDHQGSKPTAPTPPVSRHHSEPKGVVPSSKIMLPNNHEPPQNLTSATPTESARLIHIVHTRFMQHQSNLTVLGEARLRQFRAFCLPTMVQQTTQDFLWIIKVDPRLEDHPESRERILEPLIEAVKSSNSINNNNNHNIYVVASNYNFNMEGHGGSWRDGQEGEELLLSPSSNISDSTRRKDAKGRFYPLGAKVYTGDMVRLRRAHELRESLPVLETRLDADDGLNLKYLERVQAIALDRFVGTPTTTEDENGNAVADHRLPPTPKPQWLYWCILTQIEWHSEPYSNHKNDSKTDISNAGVQQADTPDYWEIRNQEKVYYGNPSKGYVVPMANTNFCITPGLTVGYAVGATVESVPRYPHTSVFPSLRDKYKLCHSERDKDTGGKGPCLERMGKAGHTKTGKSSYAIHALRSRTLTSAGMDGVGNSDEVNEKNGASSSGGTNEKPRRRAANQSSKDNPDFDASVDKDRTKEAEDDDDESTKMERIIWKVLSQHFAINLTEVELTQAFLTEHRLDIALQNSIGQCSMGHSCKDKARERLQKILWTMLDGTFLQGQGTGASAKDPSEPAITGG